MENKYYGKYIKYKNKYLKYNLTGGGVGHWIGYNEPLYSNTVLDTIRKTCTKYVSDFRNVGVNHSSEIVLYFNSVNGAAEFAKNIKNVNNTGTSIIIPSSKTQFAIETGFGIKKFGKIQKKSGYEVFMFQQKKLAFPVTGFDKKVALSGNEILFYNKGAPYYEFTNFYDGTAFDFTNPWGTMQKAKTSEHYFQAYKFENNKRIFESIINAESPRNVFEIAQKNYNTLSSVEKEEWHQRKKIQVMGDALKYKFANPFLKKLLLGTDDKILIEASPKDKYWGVGDNNGNVGKYKPGENNLLGEMLMNLREELKNQPVSQIINTRSTPRSMKIDPLKTYIERSNNLYSLATVEEMNAFQKFIDGEKDGDYTFFDPDVRGYKMFSSIEKKVRKIKFLSDKILYAE
jgi:ribA/ribD-fused uncharacterized protein